MKKIVLIAISLFCAGSTFAQMSTDFKYAVGLRAYSREQLPKIMNQTNSDIYTNTYFKGATLKFIDNQMSFRISGAVLSKDVKFNNDCPECEAAAGKLNDYYFKIGFEKNISYTRIQPYFGFDIGYRSTGFKGSVQNASTVAYTIPYEAVTTKNGGMATPFFGIKFNVNNMISLYVESSVDIMYSYEKWDKTYNDNNRTRTQSKYNKWEFLTRPISAGLQVQFGSH